jgi:KDO2-lipid IV(A) lauroyltransferase
MSRREKKHRNVRRPFETAGFMILKTLVPLLPRRGVVGLCRLAGRLAWLLPLQEKKIGLKNLDAVFGDTRTVREKRAVLTSSFATFCQTMMDVFWFSRNPEKRIPAYVDTDPSLEPLYGGKARICVTAHFGSWEVLGQTLALHGTSLASVAATIKNDHVDKMFCELREKTGQVIIPQKGALRSMIARLRNNSSVGFVLDQNTSEREGGIVVNFLGLPMPVSPAPASLAYRTGTDIFLTFCRPEKGGRYTVYSAGTIHPPNFDKERDTDAVVRELTQQIQDRISEEIRNHPGIWLWSYKHWRRRPGQHYPAHYPTY